MSKKQAMKHISSLFLEMRKQLPQDTALATTYVKHIRRLAMSQRITLPREIKRSYCKHCYQAFLPGKTCRVRLQGGKLVYYCYSCKNFTRLPYK